jgi:phosphatidylserine/phosphatidylglycerophosphate/cardiolipin synthase-like enzyme
MHLLHKRIDDANLPRASSAGKQAQILAMAAAFVALTLPLSAWMSDAQALDPHPALEQVSVAVAFTPGDEAAHLIIELLNAAQERILIQVFSFTNRDIARALIAAQRRGVDVEVISDATESHRYAHGALALLATSGVPVYIDEEHASAHNKVMVIDEGTADAAVITGSYNFTYAAQTRNAENLLLLRGGTRITRSFADNWRLHRAHSLAYTPSARD